MEVEITSDNKSYSIYKTFKFSFKIEDEALNRLMDRDDWENRLKTKIMKYMKLTSKTATGKEWEESIDAIFKEIVK